MKTINNFKHNINTKKPFHKDTSFQFNAIFIKSPAKLLTNCGNSKTIIYCLFPHKQQHSTKTLGRSTIFFGNALEKFSLQI